jgi:hypothetical protein
MKFRYIGEAPNGPIEQYGHVFAPGELVDVTDEAAIGKLKAHKFFEADGDGSSMKNKGGRPRKLATTESETDGNAIGA